MACIGDYKERAWLRMLERAEAVAAVNGGKLRPGDMDAVAALTGYEPGSVYQIFHHLRRGDLGPDAARRAQKISVGQAGRRNINKAFIAKMLAKSAPLGEIHKKLNVHRAALGFPPSPYRSVAVAACLLRSSRA